MSLITSSSLWDSLFFFFALLSGSGLSVDDSPLLAEGISPFECTAPATDDEDSPFLQDICGSGSWPPVPLACMLLTAFAEADLRDCELLLRRMAECWWGVGRDAAERPVIPVTEAPLSPAPSAAETRLFFRGGGEAPPVSESEEVAAEARVFLADNVRVEMPHGLLIIPARLQTRKPLAHSLAALVIVCH